MDENIQMMLIGTDCGCHHPMWSLTEKIIWAFMLLIPLGLLGWLLWQEAKKDDVLRMLIDRLRGR